MDLGRLEGLPLYGLPVLLYNIKAEQLVSTGWAQSSCISLWPTFTPLSTVRGGIVTLEKAKEHEPDLLRQWDNACNLGLCHCIRDSWEVC